jgi:hypothetical protein
MKKLLLYPFSILFSIFVIGKANLIFSQTIQNPSFEFWPPNCPYNVAPTDWNNFSSWLAPDQAGTCAGTVVSFEGSSHMNLVWDESTSLFEGTSQVINDLIIGNQYEMSFYATHDQGLYADNEPIVLDVYLSGVVVFSTPEIAFGSPWNNYTLNFTADSLSKLLAFRVRGGTTGFSGSVGVDALQFSSTSNLKDVKNESNHIVFFPNPANNEIIISNLDKESNYTIKNIEGKIIQSGKTNGEIDLQFIKKGIYYLQIEKSIEKLVIN